MKKLLFLAIGFALYGCESYSESGLGSRLDDAFIGQFGISRSGVSDTPLATDAYRIRGYGNQNASFEKTNSVAMVRAASLASEHGYDRFRILDFDTWEKSTVHSTPATADTNTDIRLNSYGGYVSGTATSTTTITPGRTFTLDRPRTDIVVQFVANDSANAASALRVAEIIARYGKKAGLSPEEMQAALITAPTPVTATQPQQASFEAPPPPREQIVSTRPHNRSDGPTLDEVYKMLTPGQKAQVDSLPPAKRADFLGMIRDGAH